ncbi:hypothetical protein [Neptuniibacter halophilus]|uniref:hypothetical protein n=1 Tax=Neptuniibacter halophilus TaxID=651666 RepID=UPI00257361E2|nr:hypothetical protein [Neptuniibacter halophilus]
MIELISLSVLILITLGASLYHRKKMRQRLNTRLLRGIDQLTRLLELIQRIQRHRGLCANLNGQNNTEQRNLSSEIEPLWNALLGPDYDGDHNRIRLQHQRWQQICANPADSFMSHCLLIEKLLNELTVIADTCSLTADNTHFDTQRLWQNLLQRPYFAETLGRLRALGNRAAALGHCPADIRVQILYQLQNLKASELFTAELEKVSELVQQEILTPEQIQIEPRVYFSHMTQAIDDQIQITRDHLGQLNQTV